MRSFVQDFEDVVPFTTDEWAHKARGKVALSDIKGSELKEFERDVVIEVEESPLCFFFLKDICPIKTAFFISNLNAHSSGAQKAGRNEV